jgi:hypothetical protein
LTFREKTKGWRAARLTPTLIWIKPFRGAAMHPSHKNRPNRLVRMMIFNWAFGWAVGFACAAGVLVSNVGHIRDMMFKSDAMLQFLALLFGSFGMTFGGVVAATAVMLLPTDAENGRGGGTRAPVLLPAYAYAKIRRRRA